MPRGKWLLLLLFCCSKGLVTAKDVTNRTVDRVLYNCAKFLQEQYTKCLPDNDTDFSVFGELKWIFDHRDDAACYYVLFENSTSMVEERLVQAKEAGEALRLGWERSKNVSTGMYCPPEDANCEWNFLGVVGRYFKSLDAYLTSIYDGLLTAIDEANEKLVQSEATEKYKDVCTHANLTVLTCEVMRIERTCSENCGKSNFVIPPKCNPWADSDNGYREWPVEPAGSIDSWNLGCWWPMIPGEFDNVRRLDKFARLLSSRLLHLLTFQGLCGGARGDNSLSESLVTSIYKAGLGIRDRAGTTGKQVGILMSISSHAVLKDVSTENTLVVVRRPDVNVIAGKVEYTICQRNLWNDGIEDKKDAILSAYKNANGNTASFRLQQVDKLFKWRVSGGGCFKAVVAIECAYKFTWLELGWTYFPAWHYDSDYKSVKVRSESPFSPMCADIVFIK